MKILIDRKGDIEKIIKKIFLGILAFFLLSSISGVSAEDKIKLYFFLGEGCPHCKKEKEFLEKLEKDDPLLEIDYMEVWYDTENRDKLIYAGEKLGTNIGGVPFLVIGNKSIIGYLSDETTGEEIKAEIQNCRLNGCVDIFNENSLNNQNENIEDQPKSSETANKIPENQDNPGGTNSEEVNENNKNKGNQAEEPKNNNPTPSLPKIFNIDLKELSLPALTVTLGFLDGFNPCAMWTLLFLISLLIGMEDKKRMWILGVAFIVSSAFVYFLFMTAWLNLFLFVGFLYWVRIGIGAVAFLGGGASLKKGLSGDSGCDVEGDEKRRSTFEKLGKITSNKSFILALLGIIGLAFAVNLIELICSAGFPAVYTQVLAINKLSTFEYYSYILLYILFFMIDDLFVFFVAMMTLHLTGITTKYVKYSRIIGGVLMLLIGYLLIFKPEILMFS